MCLCNLVGMKDYNYWVQKLDLQAHPEGGFYKETYRSKEQIEKNALPERFTGNRNFGTSIYFMLTAGNFSAFHRIKSDETWHFYTGSSISVSMIFPNGELQIIHLGADFDSNEVFQFTVPANVWFASCLRKNNGYGLVGCTVAPGFDFADFEMANRKEMLNEFPHHKDCIEKLTRI